MNKIKIACCDDLAHLCRYLKRTIETDEEFEVVAMAHDGKSCCEMVAENEIDILLLDIQMEDNETGINILPEIKKLQPKMKVIMLTMHDEDEFILKAFVNGANDFILKQDISTKLIYKLKKVYRNENMLRSEITDVILDSYKVIVKQNASIMWYIDILRKLSNSEFEILRLLSEGYTYRKIAKERFVSESTIRTHVHRIVKKFDVDSVDILVRTIKDLGVFKLFRKGKNK